MESTNHGHEQTADDQFGNGPHENSWSMNLEKPRHADDPDRILHEAKRAIEETAPGYHVNLVTHGDHGHPETYLFGELDRMGVDYEYVEQCGCGGHVTRVFVA